MGNGHWYYFNDQLGTPQELVTAQGEIVWSAVYKSYGNLAIDYQTVPQPLRLPGQYFDEESGLHYNRHRYYDPHCARYISQDPIGLAGGENAYSYVANPITWIDPLELNETCPETEDVKARPKYLSEPEQGGTLNIGAGLNPIEGAYNISHPDYPMAPGVHVGDANDLSNIATRSQNKIIMDNPFGYDPLNDEVLRVLNDGGTIIIRGVDGKINNYLKKLEVKAEQKGLQLISKREISSKGYFQSNGTAIKNENLNEYIFKKP